jgi:hypothetical protein
VKGRIQRRAHGVLLAWILPKSSSFIAPWDVYANKNDYHPQVMASESELPQAKRSAF